MDKPRNLAEYLGISDPRHPEVAPTAPFADLTSPKKFCQAILQSPEFRTYLLNGVLLGNLPPQILLRIMDVGWGKPTERIEHTGQDGRPIETITQIRRIVVHVDESDDASDLSHPISEPKVTTH